MQRNKAAWYFVSKVEIPTSSYLRINAVVLVWLFWDSTSRIPGGHTHKKHIPETPAWCWKLLRRLRSLSKTFVKQCKAQINLKSQRCFITKIVINRKEKELDKLWNHEDESHETSRIGSIEKITPLQDSRKEPDPYSARSQWLEL